MKAEFNGSHMRVEMDTQNENINPSSSIPTSILKQDVFKKPFCMLFGVFALIASLFLLPSGLFISSWIDFLYMILGKSTLHYLFFMLAFWIIFAGLSITFGILSIILYKKDTEKNTKNLVGLVCSIISFIICGLAILLTVLHFILL